jgi:hypothetical protein
MMSRCDPRCLSVDRSHIDAIGKLLPEAESQRLRRLYRLNSYTTFYYSYIFPVIKGEATPEWLKVMLTEYGTTSRHRHYLQQAFVYALLFPEVQSKCAICDRPTLFSPSRSNWLQVCPHHQAQGMRPKLKDVV